MVPAALIAITLAAQPPVRSIPGTPGTDGSGGDDKPASAPAAPAPAPAPASHPSAFAQPAAPPPHPIITEVLYAVPSGSAGDANKDTRRDAAGDEFVEIINPHDKPIQLFGYTLTDSQEPGKGQLRFAFPALELPPGGVAVVFNGLGAAIAGPVGDSRTPPPIAHEQFGGAWVFSMRNTNNRVAFGNAGDHVLLTAPDGTAVHRVWWSEDPAPPKTVEPGLTGAAAATKPPLIEDYAPSVQRMSVSRDGLLESGRFVGTMDAEHVPLSPGVYRVVAAPVKPKAPKAP